MSTRSRVDAIVLAVDRKLRRQGDQASKVTVSPDVTVSPKLGWGYAGGGPSVSPYRAKLRPRERIHVSTYHVTHGRVEHKLSSVYNAGWELA